MLMNSNPSYNLQTVLLLFHWLPCVAEDQKQADFYRHIAKYAKGVHTQNIYQFKDPVSPHLAAQGFAQVEDSTLLSQVTKQIRSNAATGSGFMLVETAGGPHSPGPSGTSQAQLYRPIRLPVILVADSKLGGISTSISAFESLTLRGYDIDGVAMFSNDRYQNHVYLSDYFREQNIPLLSIPPLASLGEATPRDADDFKALSSFYSIASAHENTQIFLPHLRAKHDSRVRNLLSLPEEAHNLFWWPFLQHTETEPSKLNIIDSAYGDYFQTLNRAVATSSSPDSNLLTSTLDGSASWWTQGLGHGDADLTLSAAHAAARYGHVMFASSAHEPAVRLASSLLSTISNPRLAKVFFSDNGSTAMEVGLKMALKATCDRYGFNPAKDEVEVLGFTNSYHGDTMGAMDMSEPSVYNERVPWYRGRGFWFEPPTVKICEGTWIVEKPDGTGETSTWTDLSDIFDPVRDASPEAQAYESYITATLRRLTKGEKRKFGALVMEPVVLGAGGMFLVDPLFQRTLVRVVRASAALFSPTASAPDAPAQSWSGLPVLFDEVFTGLYRLGHSTAASLLHVHPDISAHAKLLTGGLLPLAVTAASQSIYDAFLSSEKADALLHGHSYTAHPVGCAVALTSLRKLNALRDGQAWDAFRADWSAGASGTGLKGMFRDLVAGLRDARPVVLSHDAGATSDETLPAVWSSWSRGFVEALSRDVKVDAVWALGSVLAVTLKDAAGGGYTSQVAVGLRDRLGVDADGEGWNVHCRVLGNVLYLMTSQTVGVEEVRRWEGRVTKALRDVKTG